MNFSNVYDDRFRARAYASLEYPGTYYLAFRDLPAIISQHVTGRVALDFGCGAGRSTRFLKALGFDPIGLDISSSMIQLARSADSGGRYELVTDGDFSSLKAGRFDLILSAFAFDNIPGDSHRCNLLRGLRQLLKHEGRIIVLGATPDIYLNEWASFTTRDFPDNRVAKSGDTVQIVMKDVSDQRPVIDLIWRHDDYARIFACANLQIVGHYLPLGTENDPCTWISETSVAPWVIYVLSKAN